MSRTATVLVNYNGAEDTRGCVESLLLSASRPELVVVDNGSRENGVEEAISGYPGAKLIRSSENLGFGRGNNLGIRRALSDTKCEFVFLLNNDALVKPETLGKLEGVLDAHPEAGMAAPRIVLAEHPGVLWYANGGVDWRKGVARVPGYMGPANAEEALRAGEVSFASGCAMLIRRSVLERTGGFDPRFFMYEEDLELSLRIRSCGWTIRYVPEAIVLHKGQGSHRGDEAYVDIDSLENPNLPFYFYHRTKNRMLTVFLHARGTNALRFAIFYPAVLVLTCARCVRHGRWDGMRALFAGLRDFLHEYKRPFVDELRQSPSVERPFPIGSRRDAAQQPQLGWELSVAVVEPVGGHGGMDYYDAGLCEGLARAGASVTLYTCDETPASGSAPYRMERPYRRIFGSDPAFRRGLRYVLGSVRALALARLRRERIAHFHFFHVGPLEFLNVVLAKLLGLKVVITAHDVQSFVERLSVPWMSKLAYRLSDRIVAQSRVSERELRTVLAEPESKINVIPHGDYRRFIGEVPAQDAARARLGLPERARVLLFFGQIKEVKGLDVLLRAMPGVLREHPEAVLVIAGKVWKDDFGRYERLIQELGVSENCLLDIRYIPAEEVSDYYAAADVLVLPYRRIYQSGVLLMAMSYGKPVVVSDIEGMTEVVSDGYNGYVFPDGDPGALSERLAGALASPEELRLVGGRALSYVSEHHDWDRIGNLTAACYRTALKGRSG